MYLENIETLVNGRITRFGVAATNMFEHNIEKNVVTYPSSWFICIKLHTALHVHLTAC
jgi:hypothetical protein